MRAKLYVTAGSPPCEAARLMLNHKGLVFRERELPPVLSRWLLRRLGFDRKTVPALAAGEDRVQGTTSISRWLDEEHGEPPLFPSDPELRGAVIAAEAWGDETFQDVVRRLYLWGLERDREGLARLAAVSGLPAPGPLGPITARTSVRQLRRIRGVTAAVVESHLAELPAMLDRIDGWVEQGVIASEESNAADFQLAPLLATLMGMEDVRPLVESRQAAHLAKRYAPDFPAYLSGGVLPVARVSRASAPCRESAGSRRR